MVSKLACCGTRCAAETLPWTKEVTSKIGHRRVIKIRQVHSHSGCPLTSATSAKRTPIVCLRLAERPLLMPAPRSRRPNVPGAPTPTQNSMLTVDTHQMHQPSRSPPTHITDTPLDNPHNSLTHPGVASTASRFFVSMRKSFSPPTSPRRKNSEIPVRHSIFHRHLAPLTSLSAQRAAMYSTPEERHAHNTSRAARYLDSRPTIEQIAMGLHVSRTPHLRPVPNSLQRHPSPPPRHSLPATNQPPRVSDNLHDTSSSSSQYRARHSLPPPPPRSSMKKTSPSVSTLTQSHQFSCSTVSPSTSMVTSGGPPTQGSPRPLSSLRVRMSKFIPGYRPLSLPSSLGRASSFTSSASDSTRPTTPRKAVRFSTSALAIDHLS